MRFTPTVTFTFRALTVLKEHPEDHETQTYTVLDSVLDAYPAWKRFSTSCDNFKRLGDDRVEVVTTAEMYADSVSPFLTYLADSERLTQALLGDDALDVQSIELKGLELMTIWGSTRLPG